MNVTAGITSISVNGKTEDVGAIEGSGFWVYFSALTEEENEVVVYMGTESRTVIISCFNTYLITQICTYVRVTTSILECQFNSLFCC